MLQFLIEAIILCLLGGILGLLLVYGGTFLVTSLADITIRLYLKNIMIGIGSSLGIGVLAGIIPAWFASRLDPVEAIRTN